MIRRPPRSTLFPYTDALPISMAGVARRADEADGPSDLQSRRPRPRSGTGGDRSEEHTSELQSHLNLVCRLLLEKKKKKMMETGQTHSDDTTIHTLHRSPYRRR